MNGSQPAPLDTFAPRSRTIVAMDTLVTATVASARSVAESDAALDRALAWFVEVERVCSRFAPDSELMRLCARPGEAIAVSDLLFEAVSFAIQVAKLTNGAFDPTVGGIQQARGLVRNYATGVETAARTVPATYRHVQVDSRRRTITLRRPLLLDLGAVAKGFAIDLAARELATFDRFAVEAGGDLYAGGADPAAAPWRIGIHHPLEDALAGTLTVRNRGVCTSGGYERPVQGDGEHHLLDPRSGRSPQLLASVTVAATTALVADALATAVFILGPRAGEALLKDQGLAGVLISSAGDVWFVADAAGEVSWSISSG